MKKLKLNLDDLKVESFETEPRQSKIGTVLGNLMEGDTQPPENCVGGGGGGVGTNTWCFGEACQTKDYIYTCQVSCPNPETCANTCRTCQTNCMVSCRCTDPAYDTACNWWWPSNICRG